MLLFLCEYLSTVWGVKVPAVFDYYSTRMMLAAATSLIFSIACGGLFIRYLYALKVGQPIRGADYGHISVLHAGKKDTPTMGGVLILCSMLLSLALFMDWRHPFTLILLLTTLILGFAGGADDYIKIRRRDVKGLSRKKKLLAQLSVAGMVAAYLLIPQVSDALHVGQWFTPPVIREFTSSSESGGRVLGLQEFGSLLYIPFVKEPFTVFSGIFAVGAVVWIFFVVAGASNGVNLTDGLDGLAAGCLVMVSCSLAGVAFLSNHYTFADYLNIPYIEGSGEIAIYLAAFAGACLGFLWYNGFPAQVFMGDVGSLALGGILGVSTVLLKRELLLVIVGGIFVAEALSVILQIASYRWRNQQRIFLCAPLHHHFEFKGWPESKVVIRFWIVSLLLALLGIATLKFQ